MSDCREGSLEGEPAVTRDAVGGGLRPADAPRKGAVSSAGAAVEHEGVSRGDAERLPDGRLKRVTRSYVIRGERPDPRHAQAWERHADRLVVDIPRTTEPLSVEPSYRFDAEAEFGRRAPLVVEIGAGSGDAVCAHALAHPEMDHVAIEVWHPGAAQIVSQIAHHGLENIRVAEVDAARAFATMFAPGSLDEVWTFFPDPWPKAKHHKRRLVSTALAADVGRALRPGGVWRLATDWADYAWWMRDVVDASELFENQHAGERPDPQDPAGAERGGFAPRWAERPVTRFERKGLGVDRVVRDVVGVRV
ncbi:tRNA (guanosine(46)-N7)-methyltransferase TrmB [Kytococcus aerolatus]|uniref:tRNA (guanosine(46)-N7)-methyltransferase TrmB n=1 Tax=Kytococcus aerolatus TaxID=592308 RepID=UPI000B591F7F|nr:tRNA (guanosine(46)-N7)-methyltransferase TrmB [Kytococcus aerolatus]